MDHKILYYLLLLSLVCSCKNSSNKAADAGQFISATLKTEINTDAYNPTHVKYFYDSLSKTQYLVNYSAGKNTLTFFDLEKNLISKDIPLTNIGGKPEDFYIENTNKVYVLINKKFIFEITESGEITRTYNIDFNTNSYGASSNYLVSAYHEFPLHISNNFIYSFYFPEFDLTTEQNRQKYFASNIELIINKNNKENFNEIGVYPQGYLKRFSYTFSPSRTVTSDEEIIYSFADNDTLLVIDSRTNAATRKVVKSKQFEKNEIFDVGQINNYNYIAGYLTENSRYGKILYNPFNQSLYRVCSHKIPYANEDGTVNKWIEKPWSIIKANKTFETILEVNFRGNEFDFRGILATPNGLLIPKREVSSNNKKLEYVLFKI